jgi:hypothetical protein
MKQAYVQFSKRIAVAVLVFWCIYRLAALLLIWFRPELATSIHTMQTGVDDVMMVSIGFYTGNSVIEKGIVGYFGSKGARNDTEEESSNG